MNVSGIRALCTVKRSDGRFDRAIDEVARALAQNDGVRLILLEGPSCSGKTTAAKKLAAAARGYGKTLCTISIDDFFVPREELLARTPSGFAPDLDSPATVNAKLLGETVAGLLRDGGGRARVPHYDFISGKVASWHEAELGAGDVLVLEGIQAFYPNVLGELSASPSLKLFICPEKTLREGGAEFTPNDIRLMRRIVRDRRRRGASAAETFWFWENVRKNEEKYIFPNVALADMRIDSSMEYDVAVLKPFLVEILGEVRRDDAFFSRARAMLDSVERVRAISTDILAPDSLYHEFV